MPNNVQHFAINVNDAKRARLFYEKVFGWRFEAWGPADFFLIHTGTKAAPGILGSLQRRREIVSGKPMFGFECTVSVDDTDEVAAAVVTAGGKVVMPQCVLPGVGDLIFIEDPEGNVVGAMRYDQTAE
jgi:predicted enzyme related to lactoylglutathione lyase